MKFSSLPLSEAIAASAARLRKQSQSGDLRITRRDRMAIAASITWGVLLLCGTPWLDGSWMGKDDITLVVDETSQNGVPRRSVSYPALSYKFIPETPRQGADEKRPLSGFQGSHIRNKALFALGMVLIELGLGKPYEQIRAETRIDGLEQSESSLEYFAVANRVINSELLALDVGESYANAVQRCIQCQFLGAESTHNFSHAKFRKDFYTGVVAPIQATFDNQITLGSL